MTNMNSSIMSNNTDFDLCNILQESFEEGIDQFDPPIFENMQSNCMYYDIDELVANRNILLKYNFNALHLNIRSLPGKFDQLKLVLSEFENHNIRLDFILLCETFLCENNHDMFDLPGYHKLISKHRKHTTGGGVAIYVLEEHTFTFKK